ncbi:unnamed protein product [Rotaria sp. Silwood2]|nr:unnamed protein product [Rotaria sp. Silwood2]
MYSETEIHNSSSSSDDIIELNVSGERISTLRSTLTAIPKSKLALIFAKDNQSIMQSKDKQNRIFFDYNSVQFKYLLDQLRMKKRTPEIPPDEITFRAPNQDIQTNFSYMIADLGLNAEQFLSPLVGVHLNLNVSSLIGWQQCYRDTYDQPLDLLSLLETCKSRKLLVACRPVGNKKTLTLAGVGKWEDLLRQCSSSAYCQIEIKNDTGFYYVPDQAWGFEGRSENMILTSIKQGYNIGYASMTSINLNPCDSSDYNSEGRLCWSLRSNVNRGGGDRCGSVKNLHNSADWERIIYQAV